MRKGDRALFVASWSSWRGMRGEVKETSPHLMILLDGDRLPIRVHPRECIPEEPSEVSLTGAE